MSNHAYNEHLSAEQLQAFLEGELSGREHTRVEGHLAGCARCSAELDAWRVLFADLQDLDHHRPHDGFADRVMAGVSVPEQMPLAARVRRSLEEAVPGLESGHLAETVLQDYLDGQLARRHVARVEAHLTKCDTCAADADAWLTLQRRLETLDRFAPGEGFADRVMAEVRVPEAMPLVARLRAGFAALLPAASASHVVPERIQDFLEGALPARQMARVAAHLDSCATCSGEAEGWRSLFAQLGEMERFGPEAGFSDKVMAGVRIPAMAPAHRSAPAWSRALGHAHRLVPQTRQAWAAVSGVAVTPAVIAGLLFYAVFSHPTLTPGALVSFAWWQVTELFVAGWSTVTSAALGSGGLSGAYSLFETLAAAPVVVACGVLVYSLVSAVALRVLYTNLIANRPTDGRYAHAPAS